MLSLNVLGSDKRKIMLGVGAYGRWWVDPKQFLQSWLIKGLQVIHRDFMGSKSSGCPLL